MHLLKMLRKSTLPGDSFGDKKIGSSVGAIATVIIAFATNTVSAMASTGTQSWGSQPSWSAPELNSNPVRKSSYSREPRYVPVTPFSPGSHNVALDIGQVFLLGDLGSNFTDSIGARLHYTYGVSDLFSFDSSVGYSDHSEGQFSMVSALAGLRTNLAWYDKVVPYLVFGLGFYRPSYSQTIVSNGASINESLSPLLFGVHIGPGVDLELTKSLFFGASLTFHDAFGSMRTFASGNRIDAGGTFTSFLLHAGVTF